jgi:protein TonB
MAAQVAPRRDIAKTLSRPALIVSTIVSVMLTLGFYRLNLKLESAQAIYERKAETIDVVEIPPTAQEQMQAAPARPQVPIEALDEAQVEDLTIMDTQLYEQASVAVPEKLEAAGTVQEEPPMEFWMVEEKPVQINQVMPVYPEIARQAGMEGEIFVEMVVGTDGSVEEVRVLRGPPVFHEAAMEAARKAKVTPARQNDRPVRVKVAQRVSFRLR